MPELPPVRVVRLTPLGRSAVATLLVEGPGALKMVEQVFRPQSGRSLGSYPPDRLVLGRCRVGQSPGEEVVARRGGERWVELHCHGGHAAIATVEGLFVERGARPVRWQEWICDRGDDPIAAHAQLALAEARTERTAAILLDQHQGALRRAIEAVRRSLQGGDLTGAAGGLRALLARADLGLHLVEPWNVVLAGRPNVGKSSLINALVGYPRAIVHAQPGTTRDVVTAATALDGWPVALSDTAGLREGDLPVEQAGVRLARKRLAAADRVVLVFDSSRPWTSDDERVLQSHPDALAVHNKSDLPPAAGPARPAGLATSALTKDGVEDLVQAIAHRLVPDPPPAGAAVPFTRDQVERLQTASRALANDDAPTAAGRLEDILAPAS